MRSHHRFASRVLSGLAGVAAVLSIAAAKAENTDPIAVPGGLLVAMLHAEGAQIYECATDQADMLDWQFREPVATLLDGGKTVGRHFAGPTWQLADGSAVTAKVTGRAPGASPRDIPELRLEVTGMRGYGRLSHVDAIQRINTRGGVPEGRCTVPGAFLAVPYSADYAFYITEPADRYGDLAPPLAADPYAYLFGADDPAPEPRSAGLPAAAVPFN